MGQLGPGKDKDFWLEYPPMTEELSRPRSGVSDAILLASRVSQEGRMLTRQFDTKLEKRLSFGQTKVRRIKSQSQLIWRMEQEASLIIIFL